MVVPASLRPVRTAAALLGAALAAWIALFALMPGTDGFWWFLGFWVTMTAAAMLPSVAPAALLFARLRGRTPAFLLGYLAAWTAYGFAAYGVFRLFDGTGAYVAGWAVVLAGLYQLTPLKDACLRNCPARWATSCAAAAPSRPVRSTASTVSVVAGRSWRRCSRSA
jgi:predicted metal-binding membrane protein